MPGPGAELAHGARADGVREWPPGSHPFERRRGFLRGASGDHSRTKALDHIPEAPVDHLPTVSLRRPWTSGPTGASSMGTRRSAPTALTVAHSRSFTCWTSLNLPVRTSLMDA